MSPHRNLDRLIVVASVLGLLTPIARGVADSIDDGRAGKTDPSVRATSPNCLVKEARFPIVVEVPLTFPTVSIGSDLRAEVAPIGVGEPGPSDVDVDLTFPDDGRATVMVTWRGDASKKRASIGVYEVIVTSSLGRSTTCVTVARPSTTKAADRMRPPEGSTVEVIVIGRDEHPGGMK